MFNIKNSLLTFRLLKTPTFLMILFFLRESLALIKVPVSQRSSILPYSSNLMYMHAYFDMSFVDGSNLVQGDSNATYFFSKTCNL